MDNKLVSFDSQKWLNDSGDAGPPDPPFLPVEFPEKHIKKEIYQSYRVYKNEKEFVTVEAQTASQAIELSKVEKPYKVIKSDCALGTILEESVIAKEGTNNPALQQTSAASDVSTPATSAEPIQTAQTPTPEVPPVSPT